ncbi:MAG: LamG domain-containing protein [Phycisphaerae bacterium]|nr:LamG domain-containing protein [Phycisphaerae bacterium]
MIRATSNALYLLTSIVVLTTATLPLAHGQSPDEGLVLFLRFDEGVGGTVADYSVYDNDGTIYEATWTAGHSGSGLDFDGQDDYVVVADSPSLHIAGDITVEAWVSKRGEGAHNVLIKYEPYSTPYFHLGVQDCAHFHVRNSDGVDGHVSGGTGLADSGWHHVVGVRDTNSGTLAVYVDGEPKGIAPDPGGSILNNRALKIGKFYGGAETPFDGLIDEVRIYNRALSDMEIRANYAGLVGCWRLDSGGGVVAYDSSSHGNDGDISGAEWSAGISGTALDFNPDGDFILIPHSPSLCIGRDVTVSAWVNKRGTASNNIVIKYEPYSAPTFKLGAGATANFYVRNADAQANSASGVTSLGDTGWHHVVGVRDTTAGTLMVYIDGVLEGEADDPGGSILNDRILKIGKYFGGAEMPFDGVIDEVYIYNRALSAEEIADLYWSVRPDPQEDTTEGDQTDVSGTSSDPVNTATGSFFHQETDLSIPSRGMPLTFTRYYNSKAAASGRKVAKSKQAPPQRQTATSQPASKKHGEQAGIDATKHDEPATAKDQKQPAGSFQARPNTKEQSK